MLMAPMLLGADVRRLTAFDLELWQNWPERASVGPLGEGFSTCPCH
jgi:hypothetical protein